MASKNNEEKRARNRTIPVTSAVTIGANNLRTSQIECANNNPSFVANYVENKLQEFTFIVCGAPRTGKSTLINAIIGRELAATSPGPVPITQESTCYELNGTFPEIIDRQTSERYVDAQQFRINIWDTKGIKTWDSSIVDIIRQKNPMCVILCASPGSFADDEFIRGLISECVHFNIFIALVCTNQWNGCDDKRKAVMQDFHDLLKSYNQNIYEENGIYYYGNIGLAAMVNSVEYINRRLDVEKPKSGIGTLLFGIMKSLNSDKLLGWCYTLMENDGFWSQMQTEIQDFFAGQFIYGKSMLWSLSRGRTWFQN
ncbi:unnamed protein product [Rotaria sordida]|uniref:G domain-containing protein n=1 Tax=Rotaria sordida TaxID=392033 RepID=A0A818R7P1_9BILA|nr:unnamed protein product [Rotaria sordida]CAF0926690.1 unnamed protein product [Rotaria sordida]CAF1033386.1 unnamed protein product [Rotaria sordida]CAF3581285.1 unnamed protein product [Rotaria sordida]CAF3648270.1 unnamed protein product [Rotaria sordida]